MKGVPGIDYIGVGVGGVIVSPNKKIFLAQRGPQAKNEVGKWEFPGGAVEYGETTKDALVREIYEEYAFEIEVISLLTVTDHIISQEKQHWVSPSYLCTVKSGKPLIVEPEKCSQIGWFTLQEIEKKQLSLATQPDVEILKQNQSLLIINTKKSRRN